MKRTTSVFNHGTTWVALAGLALSADGRGK